MEVEETVIEGTRETNASECLQARNEEKKDKLCAFLSLCFVAVYLYYQVKKAWKALK